MKKILIISELHLVNTFIIPTLLQLKQEFSVQFDCFIITKQDPATISELKSIFTNVYVNKYPSGVFARIPKLRFFQFIFGLRRLALSLPRYDVVHISYHHYYFAFFSSIIREKAEKLYITFFGSDFNDVEWYRHLGNKKTVTIADMIFASNPSLMIKIEKKYRLKKANKTTGILVPFMDTFKSFDKYLSINSKQASKRECKIENKLIVCGYNATINVRHNIIIKALMNIKNNLTDYVIVFPMTYGAKGNAAKVKNLLKLTSLNYRVIEDFLALESLLVLRVAADIFVHIPIRDQMASSLLEHLCAGSVVITGKWLPYESLKAMGIYFIQIERIEDLAVALLEVIKNLDSHLELCKKNRNIILNLTSWETNKWSWYKAYNLIEEKLAV